MCFGICCRIETFQNKRNLNSTSWCITKKETWSKLLNSIYKREGAIANLSLSNKLPQNLVNLHHNHFICSWFCRLGIWAWLSWVSYSGSTWQQMGSFNQLDTVGEYLELEGSRTLSSRSCHPILPLWSWLVWDLGFSRGLDFLYGGSGPRGRKWKPWISWHQDMKSFVIISIPFYLKNQSGAQMQLRFKERGNGHCLSKRGMERIVVNF